MTFFCAIILKQANASYYVLLRLVDVRGKAAKIISGYILFLIFLLYGYIEGRMTLDDFPCTDPLRRGDPSQVSGFHQSYSYSNFLTGHFSTPSTSTMSSKSTSSIYYFSTKNLFELAQGDQDAQPWQVQQVLLLFIKN